MRTHSSTGNANASRLRTPLGLAVLSVALLGTAACGNTTSTASPQRATTAVPSPSATDPTAPPSLTTDPTTPVASTTPVTVTTPVAVTAVTTPTALRPTNPIDELVGAEGQRHHIRCTGSGTTTVLLIAGFEEGAENWNKIEPAIAATARVCSHDRPGTGTSDPPTSASTFASQATDLHALLTAIGEPGPYVVVGHSFGGAEAVTFASQYPTEVTGLVLIDASPVAWPAALCAVADDGTETASTLRSFCTSLSDPMGNIEHLDVLAAFTEAAGIDSLGSLPMSVITAVDRQFPGLGAVELAHLTTAWDQGQQQWLGLSSAAHLLSVQDTSHHIQLDQPDAVINEITQLLP
jgi:pimeloyl-ACP methyl ester carboxylesterase